MRTIKMTNGTNVTLDGDLLAVLESLYIEVTAKRELERTFEDMVREIRQDRIGEARFLHPDDRDTADMRGRDVHSIPPRGPGRPAGPRD